MAQNSEINVNFAALESDIDKLSTLEDGLANLKLDIKFTTAKGAVADELVEVASQLKEIGQSLGLLVGKTRAVMELARNSFNEADQQGKKTFNDIRKYTLESKLR